MTFSGIRTWSMALCCAVALLSSAAVSAQSIEFFGNGSSARDLDRVKIRIDDPNQSNDAGPPVDVGQTDFTIEFWLRPDTTAGRNASAAVTSCGAGQYSWINGNIILDRDRFSQPRSFGIALANGRIIFGVWVSGTQYTICGSKELRDGQWHHVAVQRQSAGLIEILVDGQLEASANGPSGDISYPDDGIPDQSACGGPCTSSDPFIVIGAEKHDVGPAYPAYAGWMAELRFSTVRRYTSAPYTVPSAPFSVDANTAGLYRFSDGSGTSAADSSGRGNPAGQLRVGGNPQGPVWSTESPFTGAGTINFSPAIYTQAEGGGPITISASRIGGRSGAATVEIRVNAGSSTASEGADFTLPATRVLQWANGESGSRTLAMTIIDDTAAESTETVALELANATGATIGSPATATVNITDNDSGTPPPPSGTLQFSTSSVTAAEGASAVQLTVSRTGGAAGAASVEIAVAGTGTATEGSDFTLSGTQLSWADGDSSPKSLTLTVIDDNTVEPTETASFELRDATGAVLGSPTTATVSITDNDTSGGTPPPSSGGGGGGGGGSLSALHLLWLAALAANRALRLRKRAMPFGVL